MAKKPQRVVVRRPTWKRVAAQFLAGTLVVDLATYFGWAWWTFPIAFIGLLIMSDAFGKKVLGQGPVGNFLLTIFVLFLLIAAKLWAPELFVTWEELNTPLKWILP